VRDFRRFAPWLVAFVCLGFTGPGVAWAESPRSPRAATYVEDPMAPHDTSGSTLRVGTAVGFIYGERQDVLAVGGTVAYGRRWGRLALEAEYSYLGFQVKGPSSLALGDGQRLGVVSRFDVLRLGPRIVGGNSLLSVYVEGGAAVAWNDWYLPAHDEASRIVPPDTKRVEGQVGFGIEIDHRLQEPIGFPHRVGWFLGWRMALAPHETEAAAICRGESCRPAPMMPHERFTDRSMLFQSSLAVTW
jgi:hypothetical protein